MSGFNFNDVQSYTVLENKTVKELRALCAKYELTKYSKAAKPALLLMIGDFYEEALMKMTAAELRGICKDRGITGVAKTTKINLVKILFESTEKPVDKVVAKKAAAVETVDDDVLDISSDDDVVEEETTASGTITVVNGARSRTIPLL